MASYLGTNHSELIVKPDPELILKKIGEILDQPFGDSSIIPTFLLNQFARKEKANHDQTGYQSRLFRMDIAILFSQINDNRD